MRIHDLNIAKSKINFARERGKAKRGKEGERDVHFKHKLHVDVQRGAYNQRKKIFARFVPLNKFNKGREIYRSGKFSSQSFSLVFNNM